MNRVATILPLLLASFGCAKPQKVHASLPLESMRMEAASSHANAAWKLNLTIATQEVEGLGPNPEGVEKAPVPVKFKMPQPEFERLVLYVHELMDKGDHKPCSPPSTTAGTNALVIATETTGYTYVIDRNPTGTPSQTCIAISPEQASELSRRFPTR